MSNSIERRSFIEFGNPANFYPADLTMYLNVDGDFIEGRIKDQEEDFKVTERGRDYPGMPEEMRGRQYYLTVGPESDMPGLRKEGEGRSKADGDSRVSWNGRKCSAVAMTVVKRGLNTWSVQDKIAKLLTEQLGRTITHQQILVSGLKDRKAVTAQTVVIAGMDLGEISTIQWPEYHDDLPGYFVKDVRKADFIPRLGSHRSNHFEIVVNCQNASKEKLEQYLRACVDRLESVGDMVPNVFDRQRLGPSQQTHVVGRTLIANDWAPDNVDHQFTSSVEAMLHRFLFAGSPFERKAVTRMRTRVQPHWLYNMNKVSDNFHRSKRLGNLTVECAIAKRLADHERFGSSCERVMYDVRERISLMVGAWQSFYWNWMLFDQIAQARRSNNSAERMERLTQRTLPLPMSCDYSRNAYRHSFLGRQCLRELLVLETAAEPAREYLDEYIEAYWETHRPTKAQRPDRYGLCPALMAELFGTKLVSMPGFSRTRPELSALSAALVMRLFLVPRDSRTGAASSYAPTRPAFTKVQDFEFEVLDDNKVKLNFSLDNGSYASWVVRLLFNTDFNEQWMDASDD